MAHKRISAHNDTGIGDLVAAAMEKVGVEGVITVEESRTTETVLDMVEGLQFDRGYISPYFITDAEKMEAVLEDAFVLLCDQRIGVLQDLIPVLEQVAKTGRSILFIAEDIAGDALAMGVIRVGAPSEAEMKSRHEALDDAISATKAAMAEGIVPGGGLALLRCSAAIAAEEQRCEGDERTGVQILGRALQAPARQIAENSAVDGGVVVERMMGSDGSIGFDAIGKHYVDLFDAGIIDPTKVVRIALENAVSVASVLLLTEATMTELPESKGEQAGLPEEP